MSKIEQVISSFKSLAEDPIKRRRLLVFGAVLFIGFVSLFVYWNYLKPRVIETTLELIKPIEKEIQEVKLKIEVLENPKYSDLKLYFKPAKPPIERNSNPFLPTR